MEWKPIETMPTNGKMYLLYDPDNKEYKVGNKPNGCRMGTWYYDKIFKKWGGSSFQWWFKPLFWSTLPKPPKGESL
jgi:hypothetical protein